MAFVKDLKVHLHAPNGMNKTVEAPPRLKTGQFLKDVVGLFGLPTRVRWNLYDGETDRTLDHEKSLEENGVREEHHLHLREPQPAELKPVPPKMGEKEKTRREEEVLKRCENGHFYDPAKHTTCPYCGVADIEIEATAPKNVKIGPPVPEEGVGRTRPAYQPPPRAGAPETDEPTSAITPGGVRTDGVEIDPVCGWLVCIHGAEKGKDYRIRSENNTIGRSRDMNICISGDDSISRETHAIITFDPQTNSFYLRPGGSRGLAHLNGRAVFEAAQLQPYDEILLGKTKLVFLPLCGDRFKWL
jgi:hypothetical protein